MLQITSSNRTREFSRDRRKAQRNSLDRRDARRQLRKAEIKTFHNEARFHNSAVIECSECGARLVLGYETSVGDTIGVIVISEGRRVRTFARVAWTKKLNPSTTVAGIQFLKLGYHRAS